MRFASQDALLRATIDDLSRRGALTPVPPEILSGLDLPDGSPLPRSLQIWLAASERWPDGTPALVDGALDFTSMEALAPPLAASWPGPCLLLEASGPAGAILYLGALTRAGRAGVLALEGGRVRLHSPGFAFYAADFSSLESQRSSGLHAAAHTAFRELYHGRL